MAQNLVALAKNPNQEVLETETAAQRRDTVRMAAARLYAAGYKRRQIARGMASHLSPTANEGQAYHKLGRWEKDPKFRDLIFNAAVASLDLSSPQILNGVKQAAIRGRVDAARFALEVTGRHTSHEAPVTQVAVVIQNIPRPQGTTEQA